MRKWSTHSFVDAPPAVSAAWPVKVKGEKVEGTNTSYNPDHIDKQDHLCFHLNIRGNTEANVEGLNTCCGPSRMDILCQASC